MAAASVAACNVDNIGETFSTDTTGNASFVQTVISNTSLPAATTTYNVPVGRSDASSAQTFNLTSTLPSGVCPSSVSFAAGEYETVIPLNMSGVQVGTTCKGSIKIADQEKFTRSSINVTLAKAYTWVSLGTGEFLENFWEGFVGEAEFLKAEGFNIYRIVNPYKGAGADATGPKPAYIQFEVVDSEGTVHFDTWQSPYDYDGGGHYLKFYLPSERGASYAKYDDYSVLEDGYYLALMPYVYIDGVGGWGVNYGYTIGAALPGAPKGIDEWFEEQGLFE